MSLEALLAELRKEYLSQLPVRIQTIQAHNSRPKELEDDFHKLKGTGKTYGIPEISILAEVGEIICRDQKHNIAEALPLLIALLADIHTQRLRQEPFDVTSDPRFSKLQTLK